MRERFAAGLDDGAVRVSGETLNSALALVIDLSLAVKQAHWTLRGPGFIGVHELLDSATANLREISDTMAERAVVIGATPLGTLQAVGKASTLEPYPTAIIDIEEHLRELVARYKQVAAVLRAAIDTTEKAGDADTADLFTEASRMLDKDAWFIGANLRGN